MFRSVCIVFLLSLALLPSALGQAAGRRNAGGRPVHNEAERAARWKDFAIPYAKANLTPREQQMVDKAGRCLPPDG